jgi:plastocyanin
MPDLPEELAALLHERASHAPVPAAPSGALLRAVRRRHAFRAGAAFAGTSLALAAIVGVAAAVTPRERPLAPAAPVHSTTPPASPSEAFVYQPGDRSYSRDACSARPQLHVAIAAGAPRFEEAAYTARAGATCLWAAHQARTLRHELVLRHTGGAVEWGAMPLDPSNRAGTAFWYGKPPLPAGSYELVCTIHPDMRTAVEVR